MNLGYRGGRGFATIGRKGQDRRGRKDLVGEEGCSDTAIVCSKKKHRKRTEGRGNENTNPEQERQ